MGATHFRDLQRELIGRSTDVAGARDRLRALLGALHWEGPKGEDFRDQQDGAIGELEDLVGEIDDAAAYAGEVAQEIDAMMVTVNALIEEFGDVTEVVWDAGGGQVVSVVSGGVDYFADAAGGLVDGAGKVLGAAGDFAGDVGGALGAAIL